MVPQMFFDEPSGLPIGLHLGLFYLALAEEKRLFKHIRNTNGRLGRMIDELRRFAEIENSRLFVKMFSYSVTGK